MSPVGLHMCAHKQVHTYTHIHTHQTHICMALLLLCFLGLSKHSYSDFDLLYFSVEKYFFCAEESTRTVMLCMMMLSADMIMVLRVYVTW